MSGGQFGYQQNYIRYTANDILKEIRRNDEGWNGLDGEYFGWNENGEIKEKPEGWQLYPDEILQKFKEGYRLCKMAYVYAKRIDWLVSGDDGEETFQERLKEDLEEVEREIKELDNNNWYIGVEKPDDEEYF